MILHRDLKSANVLLNEFLVAMVCDFGLSRVAQPVRERFMYSPFTGSVRRLSTTSTHEFFDRPTTPAGPPPSAAAAAAVPAEGLASDGPPRSHQVDPLLRQASLPVDVPLEMWAAPQPVDLPFDSGPTRSASSAGDRLSVRPSQVAIADVNGRMTKAAGTIMWMSPEVFRGDTNYGPAVDVYVALLTRLAPRANTARTDWYCVFVQRSCSELPSLNGVSTVAKTEMRQTQSRCELHVAR